MTISFNKKKRGFCAYKSQSRNVQKAYLTFTTSSRFPCRIIDTLCVPTLSRTAVAARMKIFEIIVKILKQASVIVLKLIL